MKAPNGFSKGKLEAASEARPKAKNSRGRRLRGFLDLGIRVPHFAHICELNAADQGLFVAIYKELKPKISDFDL